jgi:hypothetical protein
MAYVINDNNALKYSSEPPTLSWISQLHIVLQLEFGDVYINRCKLRRDLQLSAQKCGVWQRDTVHFQLLRTQRKVFPYSDRALKEVVILKYISQLRMKYKDSRLGVLATCLCVLSACKNSRNIERFLILASVNKICWEVRVLVKIRQNKEHIARRQVHFFERISWVRNLVTP